MSLTGVVLVTGANKGLGREVARQLAHRGRTVLLGCRDLGRGTTAADELAAEGAKTIPVRLDVTDAASVRAAAEQVRQDHGRLDVLINNAGVFAGTRTTAATAAQLRNMFEVNVFGVVSVTNELLPLLARSVAPRIVNVSSTTASLTLTASGATIPGDATVRAGYASAKAALNMLTAQYARAFAATPATAHVKVNAAAPGYTATDMNNHRGTRTVAEGARIVVELATLPDNGPTGGFFDDAGPLPW